MSKADGININNALGKDKNEIDYFIDLDSFGKK